MARIHFAGFAIGFLILLLLGCGDEEDDNSCKTDEECRGERICNRITGICADPRPSANPTAPDYGITSLQN